MNTKPHTIVIIGAGNVATQLGLALKKAKYPILQVLSKRKASASKLGIILNAEHTSSYSKLNLNADFYIIAVSDDAISEVAKKLNLDKQIIVHTSGSVSLDVLKNSSTNIGVFYPLQTFSKERKANFRNIPICYEANNSKTHQRLLLLARSISRTVKSINSDQRKSIHLAAVFACNFTNHFYSIAEDILKSNNMSLDILKPLIEETTNKIKENSPSDMQTGPAIRDDKKTVIKHIGMLTDKDQKQAYKLISKLILNTKKG